jgi:hypothetical protein
MILGQQTLSKQCARVQKPRKEPLQRVVPEQCGQVLSLAQEPTKNLMAQYV